MVCKQLYQPMKSVAKGKMFPIPVLDENLTFQDIYIWKSREEIYEWIHISTLNWLHFSILVFQLRKCTNEILSTFQNIFSKIFQGGIVIKNPYQLQTNQDFCVEHKIVPP